MSSHELMTVRIVGTEHYKRQLKAAIKAVFEEGNFQRYFGESAAEMKQDYRDGVGTVLYELPSDMFNNRLKLLPEPENKFDKNAIQVVIDISGQRFVIGYVSSRQTAELFSYINSPAFDSKYSVIVEVRGGKSKHVEEDLDSEDWEHPKLRILHDETPIYIRVSLFSN